MRGYEVRFSSARSRMAWLRIPMRGYEPAESPRPWGFLLRYESPCGVMSRSYAIARTEISYVTNPHAGL